MSYVLKPSTGGLTNPLTENLDLGSNDIINTATASSDNITVANTIEHTNPAGLLGFFGVPPTPQGAAIARVAGGSPSEDAINAIITILEQIGVIMV
ncbi:MAG: hypothetical protein ACYTEU_06575 [Planctomycetota bacterium]|jgi:hypothetical protein